MSDSNAVAAGGLVQIPWPVLPIARGLWLAACRGVAQLDDDSAAQWCRRATHSSAAHAVTRGLPILLSLDHSGRAAVGTGRRSPPVAVGDDNNNNCIRPDGQRMVCY